MDMPTVEYGSQQFYNLGDLGPLYILKYWEPPTLTDELYFMIEGKMENFKMCIHLLTTN